MRLVTVAFLLASTAPLAVAFAGCASDGAASATDRDADTTSSPRPDGATTPESDAASDAPVTSTPDATTPSVVDEPLPCTGVTTGSDPAYVVGGAIPTFTGGAITPGLYRAVKGTHAYVEATPGACNGIVPPAVTPYRTELELRPTHYALRILNSATSGTWASKGNALALTQACPDAKPESGVAYTATATTVTFRATKQDYLSGGCHWYMVYELARQP